MRTTRGLVLAGFAVVLLFSTGCDPEPFTEHTQGVQVDGSVCKAELSHGHDVILLTPFFEAETRRGDGCLGGVAVQLQFRAINGQIETTPWVWDTTAARAFVSTNDAAASGISSHVVCATSFNCQQFLN